MAADPVTANTVSDLLNYDILSDDDLFNDNPSTKNKRDDKATLSPRATKRKANDIDVEYNGGLGLDEEVKITKKRAPIAKLDEQRYILPPLHNSMSAKTPMLTDKLGFCQLQASLNSAY